MYRKDVKIKLQKVLSEAFIIKRSCYFLIFIVSISFLITIFPSQNAYSKEKVNIIFKNGNILKAELLDSTKDSIQVELSNGSIIKYPRNEISGIESIPIKNNGSIGVGLGIQYGILGINGEYEIQGLFGFTAGIGSSIISGLAYNLGAKLYLLNATYTWRPRLSIYYGVNGAVTYGSNNETCTGVSIGAGFKVMLGDAKTHGFDFDIIYLASSTVYDRIKELEKDGWTFNSPGEIKISFGYRYGF